MHIVETVKKGLSIAKNSLNVVGIVFIVTAVWSVINVLVAPRFEQAAATPDLKTSLGILGVGAIFMLMTVYLQAGQIGYVLEKLKGGSATLAHFTSAGGKFFGKMFLFGLFVLLIVAGLIGIGVIPVALLPQIPRPLEIVWALLVMAVAIAFAILAFFSPYAIVNENLGPLKAYKKSASVMKKHLGAALLLGLALLVVGVIVGVVLGGVTALLLLAVKGETASNVIFAVLSSLVNAFLGVAVSASVMKFYLEVNQASTSTN